MQRSSQVTSRHYDTVSLTRWYLSQGTTPSLPLVRTIISNVSTPPLISTRNQIGILHRVMEDNIHGGYFIPKGATVIANI